MTDCATSVLLVVVCQQLAYSFLPLLGLGAYQACLPDSGMHDQATQSDQTECSHDAGGLPHGRCHPCSFLSSLLCMCNLHCSQLFPHLACVVVMTMPSSGVASCCTLVLC